MKPLFTHIGKTPQENLIIVKRTVSHFDPSFHFHPECELVYIVKGKGKRLVGDSIEEFVQGDLVFLGPNIPHAWYSDTTPSQEDTETHSTAIVVYFSMELFGRQFYELEETQSLKDLFSKSERGIKIEGITRDSIAAALNDLAAGHGLKRILHLFRILECMATSGETRQLASISYKNSYDTKENHKIDGVFYYLNKNFMHDISMPEVADLCHMTPQSFCRFFKNRTKSTFIDFLNEIRISHARKLLIESGEQTIAEIAYLSGYKNLSNFNKLFKIRTGATPKEYKRKLQEQWHLQGEMHSA